MRTQPLCEGGSIAPYYEAQRQRLVAESALHIVDNFLENSRGRKAAPAIRGRAKVEVYTTILEIRVLQFVDEITAHV
jgi:hypothetical protein